MADGDLARNLPCCPGARSPCSLVRTYRQVCCGPLLWRDSLAHTLLPQHDSGAGTATLGARIA